MAVYSPISVAVKKQRSRSPCQQHVGDVVQLYAFPERSKRAAAARRRQAAAAETGAVKPDVGTEAAAAASGDAEMEDVAAAAAAAAAAATMTTGGGAVVVREDAGSSGGSSWADGGGAAAAEAEGLPVLLLRELASFRARFLQRVGKHLRADAADLVLKHQVRVNRSIDRVRVFLLLLLRGCLGGRPAGRLFGVNSRRGVVCL